MSSPYWKDDKIIVDAIWDALPEENIHFISVTLLKDKNEFENCDNYKYIMRKETSVKSAEKDAQKQDICWQRYHTKQTE